MIDSSREVEELCREPFIRIDSEELVMQAIISLVIDKGKLK